MYIYIYIYIYIYVYIYVYICIYNIYIYIYHEKRDIWYCYMYVYLSLKYSRLTKGRVTSTFLRFLSISSKDSTLELVKRISQSSHLNHKLR